ncbi:MAG: hypothetical protein JXQ23_06175 [Clostridia bacterium]|nr:hypothetical protein [Clostridia bacterium]
MIKYTCKKCHHITKETKEMVVEFVLTEIGSKKLIKCPKCGFTDWQTEPYDKKEETIDRWLLDKANKKDTEYWSV